MRKGKYVGLLVDPLVMEVLDVVRLDSVFVSLLLVMAAFDDGVEMVDVLFE